MVTHHSISVWNLPEELARLETAGKRIRFVLPATLKQVGEYQVVEDYSHNISALAPEGDS